MAAWSESAWRQALVNARWRVLDDARPLGHCPACGGTGALKLADGPQPCDACGGTGRAVAKP